MEEKKTIKISITTLFLILAIVAIIVMGVFILKINKQQEEQIESNKELKEEINKQNICVLELEHLLAKLEAFENFRDEDLKKYFKNIKKTCKLVQKTVTR